jgi:hypothetical protein
MEYEWNYELRNFKGEQIKSYDLLESFGLSEVDGEKVGGGMGRGGGNSRPDACGGCRFNSDIRQNPLKTLHKHFSVLRGRHST